MIKKSILLALFATSMVQAQFNIDGKLDGYVNKPILIKVYENGTPELVKRITTNNQGEFEYHHPTPYTGKFIFELDKGGFDLLADNNPIEFVMDVNDPTHTINYTGGVNQQVKEIFALEDKKALRDFTLEELLKIYEPNDTFYQAVQREIDRIDGLKPQAINNENIQYYLDAKSDIALYNTKKLDKKEILEGTKHHLVMDNENLEKFGLLQEFLSIYISHSVYEAKDMVDAGNKIENAMDDLLAKAQIDTSRGQAILSTIIPMLEGNGFQDLANKYLGQANALTCEMTPELKQLISSKNNVKVGSIAPNIEFNQEIKNATSLYDVNADKKLVIFWASWCPHCMNELPKIKAFYDDFKATGGEIIAISLDLVEEDFRQATEGTDWINYSDLKKWESPLVATYGVTSTPTMLLLDKNNKIIKKGSRVAEFK